MENGRNIFAQDIAGLRKKTPGTPEAAFSSPWKSAQADGGPARDMEFLPAPPGLASFAEICPSHQRQAKDWAAADESHASKPRRAGSILIEEAAAAQGSAGAGA